ncbi:MAG: protease-4 [Cognaticolwellia sp.]|jgi:protease-4
MSDQAAPAPTQAPKKGLDKGTRLLVWTLGLGGMLLVAGGVGVALLLGDGNFGQDEGDSAWMKLKLGGALPDGPMPGGLLVDPNDTPLTVHEVTAGLYKAAADPEVEGLLIELDNLSVGYAGAQELHAGLTAFREAGKECRVWSKTYDNINWLVASACDEVHIHPEGVPMVIGLSVSTTYYADLFAELGVSPDFERVGTFKSAIETYENTAPSEPTIEMYNALLDSLYGGFTQTAALGRGSSAEAVSALIMDPPVTAQSALDRGLVDAMTYKDDFFESEGDPEELRRFKPYVNDMRNDWTKGNKRVAVVHLQGNIIDGESTSGGFGSSTAIGDSTVVPILNKLAEDDDVIAVVLRIDSPGGSALSSDVMWHAIEELDEKKPVIASMGGYAASGGYYIAMGTRHIVAQPGTLTGSIGVFGGKFALGGLFEKVGISTWTSKRGDLAGLYNVTEPFTDPERAKIRIRIEAFYDSFVSKAADSRGMSWEELDAVAGGRVWTGEQGLEVGLVDELGGLERAIEVAIEKAGVSEDEVIGRVLLPKQLTLIEVLLEGMAGQQVQTSMEARDQAALEELMGPQLSAALGWSQTLGQITENGGLVAMHPVILNVE